MSSVYFPRIDLMGIDGKVSLQGLFKSIKFIANIHVIYSVAESNVAIIRSSDKQLRLNIKGFLTPISIP